MQIRKAFALAVGIAYSACAHTQSPTPTIQPEGILTRHVENPAQVRHDHMLAKRGRWIARQQKRTTEGCNAVLEADDATLAIDTHRKEPDDKITISIQEWKSESQGTSCRLDTTVKDDDGTSLDGRTSKHIEYTKGDGHLTISFGDHIGTVNKYRLASPGYPGYRNAVHATRTGKNTCEVYASVPENPMLVERLTTNCIITNVMIAEIHAALMAVQDAFEGKRVDKY